ncbi:MAG: CPBP family intramembrane metalloprotease [Lachnospiraceae bacterium]|nr:CPBP family intramembrane metalloprotease [Lachnospiraceae bacterium]
MKKLYEKNELTFALVWIGVYCVLQSLANSLNEIVGIENFASAVFCVIQTIVLFSFMLRNRLLEKYGLCQPSVPARRFLYYVPLIILATNNLWNGVSVNDSWFEMLCHICLMLCVGFMEEVIFRGFLFRAIAKDNVKTAIIISSLTFGIGHLLNLVNGSGMGLMANLFQIAGAIAFGFLFVILFCRSGSLFPCIAAHSAINILSAFANKAGLTIEKRIAFTWIEFIIIATYVLILTKILPEKEVFLHEES